MTAEAGSGGAAPAPRAQVSGARPVTAQDLPADIADQFPDGFVLPPGFALVQIPEPTPEEQVEGNAEHADMLRGVYERALDDLAALREHQAGQLQAAEDGARSTRDDWLAAEERATASAAEHGIDLGERPGEPGVPGGEAE